MGMILMLYLISTNVYNSVEAPNNRGFSYIEVWQIGAQFPILLALCEYGFILFLKKGGYKPATEQDQELNLHGRKLNLNDKIKILDYITMNVSFVFFLIFGCLYWFILTLK